MAFTFGGASTPAFGASSPTLFGGSSTPAFGAQSTSAFNFSGAASAFGASTFGTGLFGAQPASSSSFSFTNTTGSIFGSSTPAFGAGGGGLFGQQQQQQQTPSTGGAFSFALAPQQQQQLQQQQQGQPPQYHVLITKDNKPIQHSTAWDDIHPEGQKYLLELEKQIHQYREDSRQLEECERLKDSRQLKQGLKEEEKLVRQLLQSIEKDLRVDGDAITAFRERVLQLLRDTEAGVRAFQRSHRWREAAKVSQGQPLLPAVREQLSGAIILPSTFLRETVPSLQESAAQYSALAAELERVLPAGGARGGGAASYSGSSGGERAAGALDALPGALANLHATLLAVAAHVERAHERVADAKAAHLARLDGDDSDPFAEAEEAERRRSSDAKRRYEAFLPTAPSPHQGAAPTSAPASAAPFLALGAPPAAATPPPAAQAQPGGFFSGLTSPAPAAASPGPFGGAPSPAAGTGGLFGAPASGGTLFGAAASSPVPLARQPSVRKGKSRK